MRIWAIVRWHNSVKNTALIELYLFLHYQVSINNLKGDFKMVVERKVSMYRDKIKKAKSLATKYAKLDSQIEDVRDKIADYAIWAIDNGFTLTRFYKDISGESMGINYKSLSRWVNDKRKPIDEIIQDVEKKGEKVDNAALNRIKKIINKKTPPSNAKQLYEIEKTKSSEDVKLDGIIKQLKEIEFFICEEVELNLLDPVRLSELHESIFNINEKLLVLFGSPTYSSQGQKVSYIH